MKLRLSLFLLIIAVPLACQRKTTAERGLERPPAPSAGKFDISPVEAGKIEEGVSERQGSKLTPGEAAALEAKLLENTNDFQARRELLGYYFRAQFSSASARQARQKQILWIIEHCPDSTVIPSPYTTLDPTLDGPFYEQGRTLWLKAVDGHPQDTRILGNAAEYFMIYDMKTAERFLKKAQALEPTNNHWSHKLGEVYTFEALALRPETNTARDGAAMQKFHIQKLAALEKSREPGSERDFCTLDDLAKTALAAGDIGKAQSYATELLRQATGRTTDWNYGNAILDANTVLGRIALRDGRIDDAKNFLREAGKTPGSPQLGSFGPNMSLAMDLLATGETNAVLEYFGQCRKFWKMDNGQLDKWTADVKNGRNVNFGANLDY